MQAAFKLVVSVKIESDVDFVGFGDWPSSVCL
jgi:hypothetical protein